MAQTVSPAALIEARDIHLAACRYRRQGLVCSTCADLSIRAARAEEPLTAPVETLTVNNGLVYWTAAA